MRVAWRKPTFFAHWSFDKTPYTQGVIKSAIGIRPLVGLVK